jgi:asparagine synthase (glutamine-hydrolysing)
MCGIAGIYQPIYPVEVENLQQMIGALRHRGPDQSGFYTFHDEQGGIGLGSARLSIIDLAGGQQPLCNEDGSLWIVFNGEIFNYVELRPHLERLGHQLATDSDTEVILHLYEQYGAGCLQHLNGQFALAIWDERSHQLFIARDRLGVRPLYYTVQNGALLFASEIKALLCAPGVAAQLDEVTLDQIFTFWSPLAPRTAFRDIYALPPGHWLTFGVDQTLHVERYWQLSFSTSSQFQKAPVEVAASALRELLADATRIRLRADVPVGAYLSGGLDSSTIAALIRRDAECTLETFSISFANAAFDESAFQRTMARHLGTRHHVVYCTHQEIGAVFPDVLWHTETPLLRTAPAPMYLLSKLVHEHGFKVVLTGEGADEFLAGYDLFKEAKIRRFWSRQPQSSLRAALLKRLYSDIASLGQNQDAYLRQFFGKELTRTDRPDYSHVIRWQNTGRARRFFSEELRTLISGHEQTSIEQVELPSDFGRWDPLARAQYLEISIFLSEYLLSSQGDRVAMAHSVEGRFPFLDYRVVEFCNQLPPSYKLRGLNEKYLLKRAMQDLLPAEIARRPKRPYRAPIQHSFFANGQPLDWVGELLSPIQIADSGYFEPAAVMNLLKKLERSGKLGETDEMALTGILSTQLLYQQFVKDFHRPSIGNADASTKVVARGEAAFAAARAVAQGAPTIDYQ